MRKFLSRLLILLGILLILGAGGVGIYNLWDNDRAGEEVDAVLDDLEEAINPDIFGSTGTTGENTSGLTDEQLAAAAYAEQEIWELYPDITMPATEINGRYYIGILRVPSLGLELSVQEEWNYPNLKRSPCRYTGSVYTDDMVLCGHNYTRHFGRLHRLKAGTEVTFTDMAGNEFKYEVLGVEILEPTAVEEMSSKTEEDVWDMTLFTCTLGGKSRYAIRLKRV